MNQIISCRFTLGNFQTLDNNWHYENVLIPDNKFYIVEKGEIQMITTDAFTFNKISTVIVDNVSYFLTDYISKGVEVPIDYDGIIPEGLDIITLPKCKMMIFQGEPFDDEDYNIAVDNISNAVIKYNPNLYGYEWDVDESPSFQMEPQGYRGYIEGHPVREI